MIKVAAVMIVFGTNHCDKMLLVIKICDIIIKYNKFNNKYNINIIILCWTQLKILYVHHYDDE